MILHNLLTCFKDQSILVIGDIVADSTVIGSPQRISREAPVLILKHERTEILPGCAANTINNIRELGATVYAAGVIGRDPSGLALADFFAAHGINTSGLIIDKTRTTPTKNRIWAGEVGSIKQQLVRIDSGSQENINQRTGQQLINYIQSIIHKLDAIIFSDYGYGTLPVWVAAELIKLAQHHKVITTADSRYNLDKFKGVTIATPNKQESEELTGKKLQVDSDAEDMGREICHLIQAEAILITRGKEGMSVIEANRKATHIPAFNKTQVYDVTGAGDTVIGAMTLGLAAGASFLEAALIANIAASIVVRKAGTATVSLNELVAAVNSFENHLAAKGWIAE